MFSGADAVSICWHNDASETIGLYRGHWVNSPSPRIQHWQGSGPLDTFHGLLMRSKCLCSRGSDPNPTVAAIALPGSLASEQGNPFPSPLLTFALEFWPSESQECHQDKFFAMLLSETTLYPGWIYQEG